ncbi:MAG: DUF721 domain-containing protein [Firmicutes bacterium]|nr:DUF721 domain-containing protein [Bacillota bacterium]
MSGSLLKKIIENYFRRNGGWLRLKSELAVYYWPQVAGPEIGAKVEATHFRDGYLYLKTENPALAHQVSLLSQEIVKKFQKFLGKGVIQGVRVKIGSLKPQTRAIEEGKPEIELSEETKKLIIKCSQNIQDPQLAASFSMFMKKAYQLKEKMIIYGGTKCRRCGIVIEKNFEYCPCCERQVEEEKQAYYQYIKRKSSEPVF